jgi:hypothetical protein
MTLLLNQAITAAATVITTPMQIVNRNRGAALLYVQTNCTISGAVAPTNSCSISCDLQTSLDGGVTFTDIGNYTAYLTGGVGIYTINGNTAITSAVQQTDTLTNTTTQGILGSLIRCKLQSFGSYANGTSVRIDAFAPQGLAPQ